jgi:hypothetical protein
MRDPAAVDAWRAVLADVVDLLEGVVAVDDRAQRVLEVVVEAEPALAAAEVDLPSAPIGRL